MKTLYARGWLIVGATVAVAAAICLANVDAQRRPLAPAAERLDEPRPLGEFAFTKRSGRTVTQHDLTDHVWVAAFIFTRCPSACPMITATMSGMQPELEDTDIRLVSVSVDPEHDTPEVLDAFARQYGADPERWWFLTGSKDWTYDWIREVFQLGVREADEAEIDAGADPVLHSSKLALIGRGNQLLGLYDSSDPEAVERLVERATRLSSSRLESAPAWARQLPTVNASLNGLSGALLLLGWGLIRSGRTQAHAAAQIAALVCSAVFLTCYLVYHYQVGSVPFQGVGPIRLVYFTILLSHTVLAAAIVPLIALTVIRAARKRFDRHRRIAQVTLPLWLYVSATGVIIYLMLYRMDASPGAMT